MRGMDSEVRSSLPHTMHSLSGCVQCMCELKTPLPWEAGRIYGLYTVNSSEKEDLCLLFPFELYTVSSPYP